jgi:Flp pilus assembly protein TadG
MEFRLLTRLWHDQRGASLVETALVFSFVLVPMLLMGTEAANLIMQRQSIERTAREAVGHLSQYPNIWLDADAREDWIDDLEDRSDADLTHGAIYYACLNQVASLGASAPRVAQTANCGGNPPASYIDIALRKTYRELFYNPWQQSPGTSPLNRTITVQLGIPTSP